MLDRLLLKLISYVDCIDSIFALLLTFLDKPLTPLPPLNVFKLCTLSLLAELSTEEAFISLFALELFLDFRVFVDYFMFSGLLLFLVSFPIAEVLDIIAFSFLFILALSNEGSKGLFSALLFSMTVWLNI
jgi:hypothetical protein